MPQCTWYLRVYSVQFTPEYTQNAVQCPLNDSTQVLYSLWSGASRTLTSAAPTHAPTGPSAWTVWPGMSASALRGSPGRTARWTTTTASCSRARTGRPARTWWAGSPARVLQGIKGIHAVLTRMSVQVKILNLNHVIINKKIRNQALLYTKNTRKNIYKNMIHNFPQRITTRKLYLTVVLPPDLCKLFWRDIWFCFSFPLTTL